MKKQKEKREIRKNQTATINIFLLLLFYVEEFIFYLKTFLKKLTLYCYVCITVFSRGRLLKIQ